MKESLIINCLKMHYDIEVTSLTLIPIGADSNASIYKADTSNQKTYFVKLKRGRFHEANVAALELLQKAGIQEIIPPIKTLENRLIHKMGDSSLIVYPYVQGIDGFHYSLSDEQWIALGSALKQVHEMDLPAPLRSCFRHEDFSPKWRDLVRSFYTRKIDVHGEIAANLWKFLQENQRMIQQIVDHAEKFCQKIDKTSLQLVFCHSDIHGGNVLIDDKGLLYIVDWDAPILAPKERDLMFIGGGVGNVWNKPKEEELFYQGYGEVHIDWILLAYYRYERIIEDIAEYCQLLLFNPKEEVDKQKMFEEFMDMFKPHGVVDIALLNNRN